MSQMDQTAGRDLRQERIQASISQTDIARAMDEPRWKVSLSENEHVPMTIDFVQRYRQALERLASAGAAS